MLNSGNVGEQIQISEVILITNDASPHPDALEAADLLALHSNNGIPRIESVKHASKVLAALLNEPPRAIGCIYKLDNLQFSEMRASVLLAGIVALLVQAGHHAIIAPISTHLPVAHWRSEFLYRSIRGIRILQPELSEQQVLHIVTQAIHFYTQHAPANDSTQINWQKVGQQNPQYAAA
jgi:hypothetical protein